MTARVRVPATSANLGAGFDCVGIAVDRWLTASVTLGGTGISIRRHGTLSAVRVRADQDLFTRGFRAACGAGGVRWRTRRSSWVYLTLRSWRSAQRSKGIPTTSRPPFAVVRC